MWRLGLKGLRCNQAMYSINQSINQSTLFNEGDTQQSGTDKPVALRFRIELEFGNVGF